MVLIATMGGDRSGRMAPAGDAHTLHHTDTNEQVFYEAGLRVRPVFAELLWGMQYLVRAGSGPVAGIAGEG